MMGSGLHRFSKGVGRAGQFLQAAQSDTRTISQGCSPGDAAVTHGAFNSFIFCRKRTSANPEEKLR